MAIKYLKGVLEIEAEMFNSKTQKQDMAQTFINICSIYSEMGKHDIALTYIEEACTILEREYESRYPKHLGDGNDKLKFTSIVATAFHNAAVEYEFTGDFSNCLIYYSKALKMS
jgi:tetratricopeptide (TPR) repeat protein